MELNDASGKSPSDKDATPTDSITGNVSRRPQKMIDGHPANFYSVPRGESGQVNRYAAVLNPPDFHDRPAAAVFENAAE
jgi:hypothetical protein